MIAALTLLLVFQLVGEVIARALALPIPGPVIGMALLFLALLVRGGPGEDLRQTSGQLLQHLSLLFVPVGVGVMTHLALIGQHGLRMAAALVLSTWIGLAVTAGMLHWLLPAQTDTDSEAAP